MALSNAERQRRHIERLKARAAIGEQTVTNIVPAVNGGLPDEVTDKDSADYRLMHATLSLAAALAEVRELDDGRGHERFQDYRDKANALLPFVTQFSKWARYASEEAIQTLLGELEDDTNRWDEEAIREGVKSMELPEARRIALRDRVPEAFADDIEGVGQSAIW